MKFQRLVPAEFGLLRVKKTDFQLEILWTVVFEFL